MTLYCVLCHKKHKDIDWRHKKWKENSPDGWACSKWFHPRQFLDTHVPHILEDRKKYRNEMIQPFRQGELSKEFVDLYPKQVEGMVKSGTVTQHQVKRAKEVWKGDL